MTIPYKKPLDISRGFFIALVKLNQTNPGWVLTNSGVILNAMLVNIIIALASIIGDCPDLITPFRFCLNNSHLQHTIRFDASQAEMIIVIAHITTGNKTARS